MAEKKGGGWKVAASVVGLMVVAHYMPSHHHGHGIHAHLTSAHSPAAGRAIGYAWAQVGRPYCWGGTGPSCYDCSGLVMEAYQSAGISIPRTTFDEWASLRHVSHPQPGDLVLGVGSDGTPSNPGHVGIVISGGRVIQAYQTGSPIDVVSLGNFASGASGIVGYARP